MGTSPFLQGLPISFNTDVSLGTILNLIAIGVAVYRFVRRYNRMEHQIAIVWRWLGLDDDDNEYKTLEAKIEHAVRAAMSSARRDRRRDEDYGG